MNYVDITGQKFGMLTALRLSYKTKWDEHWLCKCDCGKDGIIRTKSGLRKGKSTSCGCDRYEKASKSLKKQNKYDIQDDIVTGYTTNGDTFIFDIDDFDMVKQYSWYKSANGYIAHKDMINGGILLHRLIMHPQDGADVDHKNHDKTDNRKENLRICTRSQNLSNRKYNNKTGFRGVFELPSGNYSAQSCGQYLGTYKTPQEANEAYIKYAKQKFGEFLFNDQESVDDAQ